MIHASFQGLSFEMSSNKGSHLCISKFMLPKTQPTPQTKPSHLSISVLQKGSQGKNPKPGSPPLKLHNQFHFVKVHLIIPVISVPIDRSSSKNFLNFYFLFSDELFDFFLWNATGYRFKFSKVNNCVAFISTLFISRRFCFIDVFFLVRTAQVSFSKAVQRTSLQKPT